jgi:hypothetical protein
MRVATWVIGAAIALAGIGVAARDLFRRPPESLSIAPVAAESVSRAPGWDRWAPQDNEAVPSRVARAAPADVPPPKPSSTSSATSPSNDRSPPGPQPRATAVAAPRGKPPAHDPVARLALRLAGTDPEAEAYWFAAINDPTLPPHEREDLIEDLNEEGFPDPENPTVEDLPLIVSRIRLIETLGPFAVDSVNADAFKEAHKDLTAMYQRLTQP